MKHVKPGSSGTLLGVEPLLWKETLCTLGKTLAFFPEDALEEPAVLPFFEKMKTFCLHEVRQYLREEEEEFVPALARVPGGQEKAARLQQKRAELRESIEEFKAEVALENYVGPQTQLGMLWRLLYGARQLLAAVKEHAALRKELQEEMFAAQRPTPWSRTTVSTS